MSGRYRWTDEGLYICIRCGTGLEPGHNRRCRGKKTRAEMKEDAKTKADKEAKADKKAKTERTATDLTTGFDMIHASE